MRIVPKSIAWGPNEPHAQTIFVWGLNETRTAYEEIWRWAQCQEYWLGPHVYTDMEGYLHGFDPFVIFILKSWKTQNITEINF